MILNLLRTALVLVILFSASSVGAESSVWVARSSKANVYLAGSFHMLRASDYPLPAEFFTAYQNSRKIIFEVPPGDMENPEYMGKFLSQAIYNDGTTLKDHISSAAYAKAENFCKERNYPLEQYQFLKPTMFVMTLTLLEMNKIGADPQKGIDYFFKDKAMQDGKATGSLETVDQQISLLTTIDASVGSDQILESIEELKQIEVMLGEYLAAWRKGNEPKMEELYIKELKLYPKLYQTMIVDRNNKWVRNIEGYLNGLENTIVVVGAAHLVGADGLVNLLRKRGYKVVKLQK
ncbi:MAG: TraB/GumN family protein [Deltaproteobacteria bacterium]|nr:TraB/GumN family protein [Deltaproteobacteria bacterium]